MPTAGMKGLILAAGHGTRLRPITSLRPKPTISVANKQLIHYAVDNLVEAGVRQIGIVVSHDTINYLKKSLSDYQGNGEGPTFEYIIQSPPRGLAHAVKVSRDFLGDDPFVMYLGDNLFEHGIRGFVEAYRPEEGINSVLALVRVEDPRQFGVAIVEDGRVKRLVEKPQDPPSDLAIAGVYVFDANIHRMIEGLEPGAKDEYQITDAIQKLIEAGFQVASVEVPGWWKDTGRPEDILDANRLQLMRVRREVRGTIEDSEVEGEVVIEEGATVTGSRIEGPALIGAGARVERAHIGPFTTIGDQSTIRDSRLEYAVVGAGSTIDGVASPLRDSLIGEEVSIIGENGSKGAHRLIVGDKSKLKLNES
ncbi:MAG TPA: glucose-1-phosphate thymidylyltransferase [Trueperaceae bacterium]